jgi:hypothetical protein
MVDRIILTRLMDQGLRALGELLFAAQTSHYGQGCLETWIHSRSRSHIRTELHYAKNLYEKSDKFLPSTGKVSIQSYTDSQSKIGNCQYDVWGVSRRRLCRTSAQP